MTIIVSISACDDSFVPFMGYFLGNAFSACLFGALTVQLYRYYISFPEDRKPFKAVIYVIYIMETIFAVLVVYDVGITIYDYTYRSAIVCAVGFPATHFLTVFGGIVALLTQSMYAYRIRIIAKLKYIPLAIILVMSSQLFAVVITFARTEGWYSPVIIWTSMSLFVDLTITSIMVWFLKKDEILSKQLNRKIACLIYVVVGTGLLTAATNLCILVLSSYQTTFGYAYTLLLALSKLYANSMMVLVNSRIPSARSEINHHATLDMITVRLSTFHATSQAAVDAEHEQPEEISVNPELRGVGLSVLHETEDSPDNHDLGNLTV